MEDFERVHLLEQYYLLEQEWWQWEEWKSKKNYVVERCRVNKARKNEWAYRAKQCSPKKDRGRKVKH